MFRYLLIISFIVSMASCRPKEFVPKPTGYFKIDTPALHQYQKFDRADFPYSFEYPVYSNVQRDTVYYDEKARNPYWINININPPLSATINITYLPIHSKADFEKMVNDSYGLSSFHEKKADYIKEEVYHNRYGVSGIIYTVGGNSASRIQFTATDSLHHFMRGALYFDCTPNADSLKPATDFLERDINHFLETIRFSPLVFYGM